MLPKQNMGAASGSVQCQFFEVLTLSFFFHVHGNLGLPIDTRESTGESNLSAMDNQ